MSFEEILEELPKLTADEKERLRQLLDYQLSWTEAEEQAIDEGIRSREEGPSIPWEELDGRLRDRFGLNSPPVNVITTPKASRDLEEWISRIAGENYRLPNPSWDAFVNALM